MPTIDAQQTSRLTIACTRERRIDRMISTPAVYPALEWRASWSSTHVARDLYKINVIVIHACKLTCYGHRLHCSANKHVHVCLYRPLSACSINQGWYPLLCPSCRNLCQGFLRCDKPIYN